MSVESMASTFQEEEGAMQDDHAVGSTEYAGGNGGVKRFKSMGLGDDGGEKKMEERRSSWISGVQSRLALFMNLPGNQTEGNAKQWCQNDTPNTVELEKICDIERRGECLEEVCDTKRQLSFGGGGSSGHSRNDGSRHSDGKTMDSNGLSRDVAWYIDDEDMTSALKAADVPQALYPWQAECLSSPGVLDRGENLVYCAPTSGGKSMVAEVLMLRRLMKTGRPAMLVLPFVSICAEKSARYKKIFDMMGRNEDVRKKGKVKKVVEFYGSLHTSIDIPSQAGIIVCTIEKANILVNQWMEEGTVAKNISTVCVDELHMVGDSDRGYLLELMLTKLRYLSSGNCALQIIGMSATISNVHIVATWLGAILFQTEYRPVPLHEYLVKGDMVTSPDGRLVRKLKYEGGMSESNVLVALVKESIQCSHSVIVFCCSRRSCERTAEYLARKLNSIPESLDQQSMSSDRLPHVGTYEFLDGDVPSRQIISEAIEHHQNSPGVKEDSQNNTLRGLLGKGFGWHHAGLDSEERELVEAAFKSGSVSVLCATSTLAAGVNLPARRVIFRHPYVGKPENLLNPSKYKQMAGRAGRAGLDTLGESFLLSNKGISDSRLYDLMNQTIEPITSCLDDGKKGLYRAMLEGISSKAVSTPGDVDRYVKSTLLAQMIPYDNLVTHTKAALTWLGDPNRRYIMWDSNNNIFVPTHFGVAAASSGLPPEICEDIVSDLSRAREALVLASDLHLTYICVPLNEEIHVEWNRFSDMMNHLSPIDVSVSEKVGVHRGFLIAKARGYSSSKHMTTSGNLIHDKKTQDSRERISKRFWIALILRDILQETPLSHVEEKFGIARGLVQGIQDRASRHAGMLATFCSRTGWNDLEILIRQFQSRVLHGVLPEMLELMEIPRVKSYSARLLFKAGLRTPELLASADPSTVEDILSVAYKKSTPRKKKVLALHAKRLVTEARRLLMSRAELLQQQAQYVMDTMAATT